jgi:hypothetical protein
MVLRDVELRELLNTHPEFLNSPIYNICKQFFSRLDIQQRLRDSVDHHRRPALAGVVIELEQIDGIATYLSEVRVRQAIGRIVTYIMTKFSYRKVSNSTLGSLSNFFEKVACFERY